MNNLMYRPIRIGAIMGHLQKYVFVKRSSIFVKKHSPNVILRTSSGISPFYSP
jgi:hypothetical protein